MTVTSTIIEDISNLFELDASQQAQHILYNDYVNLIIDMIAQEKHLYTVRQILPGNNVPCRFHPQSG